jgi:DNA-binding beta-propeller fold protein YncE
MDVAVDDDGNVYIADTGNSQIRAVVNKMIFGLVGRGGSGLAGDRGRAICAKLNHPAGIAVDRAGAIYIADTGNSQIRRVTPNGLIHTIAGTGTAGFGGDGRGATSAQLKRPMDVAVDAGGNIYIADTGNHRIRRIRIDGTINTIAGTGAAGFSGDGAPGLGAHLNDPRSIALDAEGNIYIADTGNHRVRKMSVADGTIRTIAGTGAPGARGDSGQGASAQLRSPAGVAIDAAGAIYISDTGNSLIRKIAPDGVITTIATPLR